MTVANNPSRDQYTATSGQTVFPYTFEIFNKDDVVVVQNSTILAEGTNYTVSNVGNNSGGNITFTVGATAGDTITIYRDMAYERTTDYQTSGDFLAAEVNADFDRLWLAVQQNEEVDTRAIRKPITDAEGINVELPAASARANKVLSFDASGNVIATPPATIAEGDASNITYTADYTSAVETTVQAKLDDIASVKDFGAVGNNSADDTAAIQAALDSGAQVIFFPAGTYKVTSEISTSITSNLAVIGEGARINVVATEIDNVLKITVGAAIDFVTVRGLYIDGNSVAATGIFVEGTANSVSRVTIENNIVENLDNVSTARTTSGIRVDALGVEATRVVGNTVKSVTRTEVNPGTIASVGIRVTEIVHGVVISGNHIEDIDSPSGDADADGIHVFSYNRLDTEHQTAAPVITENYFYNCKGRFIKAQSANVIVSDNRFEINDQSLISSFRFVDLQTGGGIVSNNTAFYNPAIGTGTSGVFCSMNPRDYAIEENLYIVSNNALVLQGDMFAFAFSYPFGVTNATIRVSDNIVSDRFDTYNLTDFFSLNIPSDIDFLDVTVSNNQINYLGNGSLFSFYQDCLDTISDAVTGPVISAAFRLALTNNSVRTGNVGLDLIEWTAGPTTGAFPYMQHLLINGNTNFNDSQVLCQGMDVNLLPEGTSFYFTTDGSTGGLLNAPTNVSGFHRFVIVERVGTFWCRVSKLTGTDVALFRTDVPSGYLFSSATALTF